MRCSGSEPECSWLAVCQAASSSSLLTPLLAKYVAAKDWQQKPSNLYIEPVQITPVTCINQHVPDAAEHVHLAQFLSELSSSGHDKYDSSCLLGHPNHIVHQSQLGSSAASKNPDSITVLEAIATQSLPKSLQKLPGLAQVAVVITQDQADNKGQLLLMAKPQHSLADMLCFSPQALQDDELCRVMLFEVLLCLQAVHAEGLYLGNLAPDSIWLAHGRQGLSSLQGRANALASAGNLEHQPVSLSRPESAKSVDRNGSVHTSC